jgi:hypothetical protein
MVCSIWWEEPSFYRSGRWPKGGAGVIVVVAVPRSRRGKAWARTVAGVLEKLTRAIVARQGLCSDGALDGNAQHRGGSRRR